jgi:hypothetical protein
VSNMYLWTAAKSVQLTSYAKSEFPYNILLIDISNLRSSNIVQHYIKIFWLPVLYFRQYESKETTFKVELVTLSTLLPTLHTQLVTSAAFCSSANRFEFLDLAYVSC